MGITLDKAAILALFLETLLYGMPDISLEMVQNEQCRNLISYSLHRHLSRSLLFDFLGVGAERGKWEKTALSTCAIMHRNDDSRLGCTFPLDTPRSPCR